jgi:hypothetical protein
VYVDCRPIALPLPSPFDHDSSAEGGASKWDSRLPAVHVAAGGGALSTSEGRASALALASVAAAPSQEDAIADPADTELAERLPRVTLARGVAPLCSIGAPVLRAPLRSERGGLLVPSPVPVVVLRENVSCGRTTMAGLDAALNTDRESGVALGRDSRR